MCVRVGLGEEEWMHRTCRVSRTLRVCVQSHEPVGICGYVLIEHGS